MPVIIQIPEKYRCSITRQIMIDPVIAMDGHTYEREAIEQWLQVSVKSPKTNLTLPNTQIIDNHDKRSDILEFLDGHPDLYNGDEVYLPQSWVEEFVKAIKSNQSQVLQRWLDKDRRLLTAKLEGDSTAIHLAFEFGSPQLVNILLNLLENKDPSIIIHFNRFHLNNLLEKALTQGDYNRCELLLKIDPDIDQPEILTRSTLLHRKIIQGDLKSVIWLLEQNASLKKRNREGNTSLLLSTIYGHIEITRLLLEKNANPNTKNLEGKTPFYIAAEKGDMGIAKLLLAQGANPAMICEPEKSCPLHVTTKEGDAILLQYLLQTRVIDLIDAQDIQGNTPLHLAVENTHDSLAFLLLNAGASAKIKNNKNQTSVELAKAQGKWEIAALIGEMEGRRKKAKLKGVGESHQEVLHSKEIVETKTENLQLATSQSLILSFPALTFSQASLTINPHIPAHPLKRKRITARGI